MLIHILESSYRACIGEAVFCNLQALSMSVWRVIFWNRSACFGVAAEGGEGKVSIQSLQTSSNGRSFAQSSRPRNCKGQIVQRFPQNDYRTLVSLRQYIVVVMLIDFVAKSLIHLHRSLITVMG